MFPLGMGRDPDLDFFETRFFRDCKISISFLKRDEMVKSREIRDENRDFEMFAKM